MNWIVLVLVGVFFTFGFVILCGAPYLPTKKDQINEAIKLMNLRKGQTLLELGCGDGRLQRACAKKGIKSIGYELNPILVIIAKLNTYKYRNKATIIWGNYWRSEWPKAEAIYTFLLDKYMPKLDQRIEDYKHKPVVLVSFAFEIPAKKHTKESKGLFVYHYK